MPGGVNPSQTATPDTTPRLQDSSLQQGDVAMLQEGQQMMKQSQKPATGGATSAGAQRQPTNVQVPDAIDFIAGRAGDTMGVTEIGAGSTKGLDISKWRPLMEELARDPNVSGPLSTAMLSRLSQESRQINTVGVDVMDINAAQDAMRESLG